MTTKMMPAVSTKTTTHLSSAIIFLMAPVGARIGMDRGRVERLVAAGDQREASDVAPTRLVDAFDRLQRLAVLEATVGLAMLDDGLGAFVAEAWQHLQHLDGGGV